LELRVVTLWGKARLVIWWWGQVPGQAATYPHRNAWLVRQPKLPGKLSDEDSWESIHEHKGGNAGFDAGLRLFERHMPAMASTAEHLATAIGAPFLRVDFFVGSPRWGVRLNEVAYGSMVEHRRPPKGDSRTLVDDSPAIARILREGAALCHQKAPSALFLEALGARGATYAEMSIERLPPEHRPPVPPGALPEQGDPNCEQLRLPIDRCQTPRRLHMTNNQMYQEAHSKMERPAEVDATDCLTSSTSAVIVTFRNALPTPVNLHWVCPNRGLVYQNTFQSGMQVELQTFSTHEFVVTDSAGVVLKTWQAKAGEGEKQLVTVDISLEAVFKNASGEPISLFWKEPTSGTEVPQAEVKPAAGAKVRSAHAHEFVVRSHSNDLIRTWRADVSLGEWQEVLIGDAA